MFTPYPADVTLLITTPEGTQNHTYLSSPVGALTVICVFMFCCFIANPTTFKSAAVAAVDVPANCGRYAFAETLAVYGLPSIVAVTVYVVVP